MSGRLDGQRVLITGASAGIGRAAVVAFAEAGASVVAVARSEERLRALAEELGGPPRVTAIVADVTDPRSMEAMTARVLAEGGAPDVLVANAGIGLDALLSHTSDESMRAVFDVNVFGVVRTLRPFLAPMTARGSGRILLISSVVGKRGIPHYAIYSASKFALHGMADALRAELQGTGVTVGVICPATTESEFGQRRIREGPPQGSTRVGRQPAEAVARVIVAMARSRRRERVLTLGGKALVWLDRLAPGFTDWLLARILVRRGE